MSEPTSAPEVIEALAQCVRITVDELRAYFVLHEPGYLRQAEAALALYHAHTLQAHTTQVIANFDDVPTELDEIHAYYAAIDNAETWRDEEE